MENSNRFFANKDCKYYPCHPELGEIGIFYLNGQGFCKRLGRDQGAPLLISLNHAYAPLHVREDDEFRVFGKVVG